MIVSTATAIDPGKAGGLLHWWPPSCKYLLELVLNAWHWQALDGSLHRRLNGGLHLLKAPSCRQHIFSAAGSIK